LEPGNRRLIRPSLTDVKERPLREIVPLRGETAAPRGAGAPPRKDAAAKKVMPPDQTNAENFYYLKHMQSKTPMTIVLKDGEILNGVIEWYDKCCLKLNRDGAPNLLIYKSNVKYMHKA
jgi:sRNA-binding regulator protein Hfq